MFEYADAMLPTEKQREKLATMMYQAFLEVRVLGLEGKAGQAADLADTFHNLPMMFYSERFSLGQFRHFLEACQQKYSQSRVCDYLKSFDELVAAGE